MRHGYQCQQASAVYTSAVLPIAKYEPEASVEGQLLLFGKELRTAIGRPMRQTSMNENESRRHQEIFLHPPQARPAVQR
jgi:hypothetical protein